MQFAFFHLLPFITQPFAFNFNSSKIVYWLPIARPREMLSYCPSIRRRHLNSPGIFMRRQRHDVEKISFTKREEKGSKRNERCNLFLRRLLLAFSEWCEKKEAQECGAQLLRRTFKSISPLHRRLIKILPQLSTDKKFVKEKTFQVFTVKFHLGLGWKRTAGENKEKVEFSQERAAIKILAQYNLSLYDGII